MIRSLRMRLFAGTTLLSAVLFTILGFTIITAVDHTLQQEFDRVLLEKARTLASLLEQSGTEIHFDYRRSLFPEFEPGDNSDYFEILVDGRPYARSLSLEDHHLPLANAPSPGAPVAQAQLLPSGLPGRRITLAFQPIPEPDDPVRGPPHMAVLALAIRTTDLVRTMDRIRLFVIVLCATATLLSGIALLLVVGRAIAPVKVLAAQIEAVRIDVHGPRDTSAAFITAPTPAELAPVVDRLNDLLGRLSGAFARERSFTADAAHELRTPLAGLLATLEVCRTRPRSGPEYEAAIDKCLAILAQMRGMTEKLLLLSRAEAGQVSVRNAPLDLPSLLQACWQSVEPAAHARHLRVEGLHAGDGPAVFADAELMRIVFHNLFDNAVAYARADSVIEVRLGAAANGATVCIANTGHALSPDDVPRLFERFWRKDTARAATGRHAGLGLSLCQRLLALQGGTIRPHIEADRFIVSVELPVP